MEFTAGHSDFNLTYDGEGLVLRSFFGNGAVINGNPLAASQFSNPSSVVTRVPDAAKFKLLPGDEVFLGFTGFAAGDGLWSLPQTSSSGIPFLGLNVNAGGLPSSDWFAPTTWSITGVSAPVGGYFSLWSKTYGSTHRLFSQGCVIGKRCRVKDNTGRHFVFNLLPAIFHQPFPRLDPGAADPGDTRTTVRHVVTVCV